MKSISYISMIAMVSIVYAMVHIIITDAIEIWSPTCLDKTLYLFNFRGLPYFYGIASFMFEGNAVQLDIY
jgi:hypothetical protein